MQTRAIRSLCYALILAVVTTIVPTPFAKPASAQLMPTYSVGVVDFVNESGVQGDLLARLATDAVVVEMSKTNRYDVSITRSMMKSKMEELGLHAPLTKLDIVRLGEVLSADAMLEGSIKSVQLAGSGATRRASVTLVVQMIDQASGEIINGAVQTGTSSARVGYTADDNSLIAEAINSAAFLAVKTMVDYIIPEATVMMNIGESQVMLNKGVRDGIKAGMRMIVLRDKEIIGYLDVRDVTPQDATAKVVKSMRGIQPEDKARAIFEMPMVTSALKSEPLPSGAPKGGRSSKGAAGTIGKFLVGLAIVAGVAAIFKGGSGASDPPTARAGGPMVIKWDPQLYGHGNNMYELEVVPDAGLDPQMRPVWASMNSAAWNLGYADLTNMFGTNKVGTDISYNKMDFGQTAPSVVTWTAGPYEYGVTHTFRLRALLREQTTSTGGTDQNGQPTQTYKYVFTDLGNYITATPVEPVDRTHIVFPQNGGDLMVSQLLDNTANLTWSKTAGADEYQVSLEPVEPGKGPIWKSSIIYYGSGDEISLPDADRMDLARRLSNAQFVDKQMRWRVDGRHQGDTSQDWTKGETVVFRIAPSPSGPPQ